MTNPVQIGDATLYLGDCLESRAKRQPWGRTPLKEAVSCRACDWTWKPYSGFGNEACPKCGRVRSVRARTYAARKNVAGIAEFRKNNPGYSSEWGRRYRRRAVLLVGRGEVRCVRCGCNRAELLEINHKNGGGAAEYKRLGTKFYTQIAKMRRSVDDLELLCRPCNAIHFLETKHGPLPFRVVWEGNDAG